MMLLKTRMRMDKLAPNQLIHSGKHCSVSLEGRVVDVLVTMVKGGGGTSISLFSCVITTYRSA